MKDSPNDPLLHFFEFPFEETFFPYGFPLAVRTNDERILHAARESFGMFQQESAAEPLQLSVAIVGHETGAFPAPPVIRSHRHLLWFVSDSSHFGTVDLNSGGGVVWLTPRVFSDIDRLRFHFLESHSLSLVAERHLTGIHAACVSLGGNGVLLCGDGGAGKSTLAYNCARNGWTYVSDDGSFLIRKAADNIVLGTPHRIRFRPSAVELFPELSGYMAVERPNGKMTIEVKTSDLAIIQTAGRAGVRQVVFLNRRQDERARLSPVSGSVAADRLSAVNHYGTPSVQQEKRRSLDRLLTGGAVELTYWDLDDAVDCLESLVSAAP